jgi:uncharacterized protein (DUF58 family)
MSTQTSALATAAVSDPAQSAAPSEVIMISQISRAWVGGAVVMLVVGAIFFSEPLFGLGMLLSVVLLGSWAWARWCLVNLQVMRRFSHTRAFWGEVVAMDHLFVNNKPLPLPWLIVEDEYPSSLKLVSHTFSYSSKARTLGFSSSISLGWYERITRHYAFLCTARGEHEFGPIEIRSGDIFGLFRRYATYATPTTLLVYPRYVPVERLGITARQPFGDYKAVQQIATDPLRLRAVREYVYGDNQRHIHWKATARRGELQTKLFEPSATPQLSVFLNQDTFVHMYEGLDPPTLELAITTAASVANHALEQGWMVGLQINAFASNSDRQVKIPPSRDPGQLMRVLESLARIKGWSGLPVEDLLRAQRYTLSKGSTLVVVTGVVTSDLLDVLVTLRRAGHPVTLIETVGSNRASNYAHGKSPASIETQGITYYLVDAIGEAETLEDLTF